MSVNNHKTYGFLKYKTNKLQYKLQMTVKTNKMNVIINECK